MATLLSPKGVAMPCLENESESVLTEALGCSHLSSFTTTCSRARSPSTPATQAALSWAGRQATLLLSLQSSRTRRSLSCSLLGYCPEPLAVSKPTGSTALHRPGGPGSHQAVLHLLEVIFIYFRFTFSHHVHVAHGRYHRGIGKSLLFCI